MGDNTEKWPEGEKSGSDSGVDQMKINIWANILGKEDIYLALISLKIYFHLFNLAFILENKTVSTQSFL